jgi:hypothetical protein
MNSHILTTHKLKETLVMEKDTAEKAGTGQAEKKQPSQGG